MSDPDVLVLGSGQAGGPLAWRLARAGRRVILVEEAHLGGTCVNVGCTPTKAFIASAEAAHRARTAGDLGVRTGEVEVDMEAVVSRKDRFVREWRASVAENVEKTEGLTLLRGHARFTGPRRVRVGDRELGAETVIVNVGARPVVPPILGLDDVPWHTNETVMDLRSVPDHLIVLGGGYIGCEFAQAFRRFGSAVTVVEAEEEILGTEDADVGACLREVFEDDGIAVRVSARAAAARVDPPEIVLEIEDGEPVRGSHLLLAVGRRPNTDDLGCEAAGIALDERGYIQVDDHFRTSAEGVWAVGDCVPGPQFTHRSWDDHRIVFDALVGEPGRTGAGRLVPRVAFTDPQVARVGLSEREAEEAGRSVEVASMPFGRIARAKETGRRRGLVKVLVDPDDERIAGACVVGAEAGELIHVLQMLMQADAPASVLVDGMAAHPTFAEGLHSALMTLDRYRLS